MDKTIGYFSKTIGCTQESGFLYVRTYCTQLELDNKCDRLLSYSNADLFWLSPRNFFQGGGAKSIVMQISIVILLFSDQISGRGKSFQRGAPPLPPVGESQYLKI